MQQCLQEVVIGKIQKKNIFAADLLLRYLQIHVINT